MGNSDGKVARVALVEARAARAALRRLERERRKAAGVCTVEGCGRQAADGQNECEMCGPHERARKARAAKERRDRARELGLCFDCGAKSSTCRCVDCQLRFGTISRKRLARIIADSSGAVARGVIDTRIERDARYPEGRVRTRYRGALGRRGAPSKEAAHVADLALAVASIRRAMEKLEGVCNVVDKRARQAVRDDAMGQVSLAGRMLEEVLERDGYEQRMRRR